MGMTYAELSEFGRLRKQQCAGPLTMFATLIHTWKDQSSAEEVAEKVIDFMICYGKKVNKTGPCRWPSCPRFILCGQSSERLHDQV